MGSRTWHGCFHKIDNFPIFGCPWQQQVNYDQHILSYLASLGLTLRLPPGVKAMNPYENTEVFKYCQLFYHQYYADSRQRTIILGINPGRHGAGLTGIPFTDPIKLESECGIPNNLHKRPELSADFIYQLIHAYGGLHPFYRKFYFSSVCPLGFTKDDKNINYYDIPKLQKAVLPFICQSIRQQLDFGISKKIAFCLGEGKNYQFLRQLNESHGFFEDIIPLPHPRFIMQYRRKKVSTYIDQYLEALGKA